MGRTITVNGVDLTAYWRQYESRWTNRAYLGESSQSELVFDDDANNIDHADLATRKIVEIWDDASGASKCLYRGRVASKTLARGDKDTAFAIRWTVMAEDYNIDLSGIRITDSHRPEESDRERVLAFMFGYLNGASSTNAHARDSTELDGTYVLAADLVTLPTEDYRDTFPGDVFQRICEISAKTFFVFVDDAGQGQLYYASHDDTTYASTISITDVVADVLASPTLVYAPIAEMVGSDHEGQQLISGGSVRYGDDEFYEDSDIGGSEADHDKWEEHLTDDFLVNSGSATAFLNNVVASRNNENFTHSVTIQMKDAQAHLIKAGMTLSYRHAASDVNTPITTRAVQVQHSPTGPGYCDVTIEMGIPRGRQFRRHIRHKPSLTPKPAQPDVDAEVGISWVGCNQVDMSDGDDMTMDDIHLTGAQIDDLILVHMSSDSDSTIPTAPSGWTAIAAGGSGVNVSSRGFWHIYTGTVTDFDFGSGNSAIIHAYRGIDQADPIGSIAGTGAGSTTMTWPALSGGSAMEITNGTSWVVAFGHHKSDATVGTDTLTANDVTNRCHGREGNEHGSWDTNGGVSSWASHTLTVSNDQWQTSVYEIRADQAGTGGETNDGPADEVGTPNGKYANFDHHHEDMLLFQFTLDNGSSVLATGLKWWSSPIPFAGTITAAYLDADVDGACVVDIGKGATWTGSHFSSICGGNKPTITATGGTDLTFTDTTLTGWTTDFAVNTRFSVNLDSVTSFKKLTFGLRVRKLV